MAYVGLTSLKEGLRVSATFTTDDSLLTSLESQVSKIIDGYVGFSFGLTSYDETFNIDKERTNQLFLTYRPIDTVVAVTNDGGLVAVSDYHVYKQEGIIQLKSKPYNRRYSYTTDYIPQFTVGPATVSSTYKSGYVTIPDDIKLAVILMVKEIYARVDQGLKSESLLDYRYTRYDNSLINPTVEEILKNYRLID